jgi:hypothetical protein
MGMGPPNFPQQGPPNILPLNQQNNPQWQNKNQWNPANQNQQNNWNNQQQQQVPLLQPQQQQQQLPQQQPSNPLPYDPKRAPTTVDPNDRIKKQGYFHGNNWPSYNMNNYYPNSWQYQPGTNEFQPVYSGANGPSPYYQNPNMPYNGNNQFGYGYSGYAYDGNGHGGPYGYGYDNSLKGCASYPCYNNGVNTFTKIIP